MMLSPTYLHLASSCRLRTKATTTRSRAKYRALLPSSQVLRKRNQTSMAVVDQSDGSLPKAMASKTVSSRLSRSSGMSLWVCGRPDGNIICNGPECCNVQHRTRGASTRRRTGRKRACVMSARSFRQAGTDEKKRFCDAVPFRSGQRPHRAVRLGWLANGGCNTSLAACLPCLVPVPKPSLACPPSRP